MDYRTKYNEIVNELKMYRTLEHGSYSYPFMYCVEYHPVTGKKLIKFTCIQVTGWKFINKVLNFKYKMNEGKVCLIGPRKKYLNNNIYPTIVYYDYMKSHLDYLKQLSLPPLPDDYDKFQAYYGDRVYSKWFPYDYKLNIQYECVLLQLNKILHQDYYKQIIDILSGRIKINKRNNRVRFNPYILKNIHEYLI